MDGMTTTRRSFVTGAAALGLSLKYGCSTDTSEQGPAQIYRAWEDLMRNKWTWDRVVRGTHGSNCASGGCAFNVYVKNGVVWREEQQGEYGFSGDDVPDYGPRGCQKGLRHSKYMYGPQRVLYPRKRVGKRGEGQWERITWEQALDEIADKFIDNVVKYGPDSISYDFGTGMIMKRASAAGLFRFGNLTGIALPELFAGVGDLPTGVYITTGAALTADCMAAVYKSRACLIWYCNPAVTRIPDAHFFWEARYNGTKITAISPEFTPTAMHADRWLNPKPGTDAALALSMVQTILTDGTYDAEYIREQTDLPFLVRTDTGKYLRGAEMPDAPATDAPDHLFYVWDQATDAAVPAPATGRSFVPPGMPNPQPAQDGDLMLGDLRPALEGDWIVETVDGPVEVTTVFEKLKAHCAERYTPEKTAAITGLNPTVVRTVAREFASAKPAMIFSGYAVCKWLNGDMMQRSFLLLLSVTGNLGPEGGGFHITRIGKGEAETAYAFADVGPAPRVVGLSMWDYQHTQLENLNAGTYGQQLAEEFDGHYQEAIANRWIPSYSKTPWKMAFYAGCNAGSWRASGKHWRETVFGDLETVVAITTDMHVTAFHSDYVLPVAHHYERKDMIYEVRHPYVQVLDAAVPPVGESLDDWTILKRLSEAISRRAIARNIDPIEYDLNGLRVQRDLKQCHELYTLKGQINETKDLLQFLIDNTSGIPNMPFGELAERGLVRMEDTERVVYGDKSPYPTHLQDSFVKKRAYGTMTGRQQFYLDHDWFRKFDEMLPTHKDPMKIEGYPLQMMMCHARHGIHGQWRDDSLLVSLQRGEPDIFVSPEDAEARGVTDGDKIRVFSPLGSLIIRAHVSSTMQPGMIFMYHGWDPMMFEGNQNFGAVIPTAGLIKPTSIVAGYGHLHFNPMEWAPNATFKDFTCDFEKYDGVTA